MSQSINTVEKIQPTRLLHSVQEAALLLENGEVVGIPTETVYGLAGNGLDPESVLKIYAAKERPKFDPLILHLKKSLTLGDLIAMEIVSENLSDELRETTETLMRHFWPGALTLVLPKGNQVPDLVTSGLGSVALRMPSHEVTQELLSLLDFPLAAPSANRFGKISPTSSQDVVEELDGRIAAVLEGGRTQLGLESTIVALIPSPLGSPLQVTLLRPGAIPPEEIHQVLAPLGIPFGFHSSEADAPREATSPSGSCVAPGLLKSHYAPNKPLTLVSTLDTRYESTVGVLSFSQPIPSGQTEILSLEANLNEAAHELFAALRRLDQGECQRIVAERAPSKGLGWAINDRLERASFTNRSHID